MKKRQSFFYFFIFLIISLLVFWSSKKNTNLPFLGTIDKNIAFLQGGIYSTGNKFWGKIHFLRYFVNYSKKIANLEERNRELLEKSSRLLIFEKENKILKEQLNILNERNKKVVMAKVVGYRSGFKLDKGSLDKIKIGMPVVYGKNLVGKIKEVSLSTAMVELPTDTHSKIMVYMGKTKAKGILSGRFDSSCILDFVEQNEALEIGDFLYTTGENGIIPADFTVGTIKSVEKSEKDLFQKALVEPVLDFRKLTVVLVIVE